MGEGDEAGAEASWVWVKRLGVYWVTFLDPIGRGILLLGLVLAIVGASFAGKGIAIAGLIVIVVGFVVLWFAGNRFTRLIRCPECGHNPTRRKDGKARRDWRKVETQVRRLTACPKCQQ